jgi:hypothetical protein
MMMQLVVKQNDVDVVVATLVSVRIVLVAAQSAAGPEVAVLAKNCLLPLPVMWNQILLVVMAVVVAHLLYEDGIFGTQKSASQRNVAKPVVLVRMILVAAQCSAGLVVAGNLMIGLAVGTPVHVCFCCLSDYYPQNRLNLLNQLMSATK